MKFAVVIERGRRNFSAFSPDLPGCVCTAGTRAAIRERMKAAIRFHLEGLRRRGLPVPKTSTSVGVLDVARKRYGDLMGRRRREHREKG